MNKISSKLLLLTSKLLLLTSLVLANIVPAIQARENTSTPAESPQQSTSILKAILSLFKSTENRFVTRGDEVCLISPGNAGEQVIWSDRPLFIWQGKIPESEINLVEVPKNLLEEEQLVWMETVPENIQSIAYTGDALKPGITYKWKLISNDTIYNQTITLMEESEREAIAAELTDLENTLDDDATVEDIAIERADFFTRKQLGYDALQQLYSVPNPSDRLKTQINEIEQYFCNLNE